MSGVPKRSHEDGVTHPSSSSSAKYPHDDSGSYPKSSTHPPPVTPPPPPAQVHQQQQQQQHHHHQQPQSQSHIHALPHPHSHPHSLPAASASAYEVESRTVKAPRSEPRGDGERRSPLQGFVYRSPSLPTTVTVSSSNDPHLTHTPVPLEPPRDGIKDGREIRVENRENRSDGREIYGETKREIQGPKGGERDAKFERLVDDFSGKGNTGSYSRNDGREIYSEGKREVQGPKSERDAKFERPADDFSGKSNTGSYARDTKFDRENQNYNDQKTEIKTEKDGHAHLAWKEQKDYLRGKRIAEGSANVEPWVAPRGNLQGPTESGVKDFSAPVEGAHLDGRETVGENKVDAKSEDRFKDKDKKRKELKHREYGDRDKDRNDRRGTVLVGSVVSEPKEIGREERETDRWERERMEQKDRERNKEKDKDLIKRETRVGVEKEISQNEKELGEASAKPVEQEHVAPEQKKQNEPDGWEKEGRESKEKRRERDGDSEAERAEKRSRISEKESEDGCLEGEGATDREKDAFNYGVQQRKRMLRPRGSPQTTNRDFVRSRSQDNEGCVSLSYSFNYIPSNYTLLIA